MGKLVTVSTRSDPELTVMREFDAPARLIWDAHTKPELLKRWLFGPPGWSMPHCTVDLRVGGRYRYVWRNDQTWAQFGSYGEHLEVAPFERIVTIENMEYPLGSVPFLEDEGGVAIGESVAQMLYLAGRYGPTSLLPTDPAAMARVLQIAIASEASLGGLMNPMMGTKFIAPEDQKANWTDRFCAARVTHGLTYADGLLGGRDYFVGDGLTLADIAISTAQGMWQGALGKDIPAGLAEHRARMQARPAYQKAAAAFQAS